MEANPPESLQTDISLSQFLAIQEKGVSAWEFEPELEIANCFVEARTEIEFFDSECSVQSNLPVPKQNEVYYWEAKIYDKPEPTLISIGMATKPYPLFRLPGKSIPSPFVLARASTSRYRPLCSCSHLRKHHQVGISHRSPTHPPAIDVTTNPSTLPHTGLSSSRAMSSALDIALAPAPSSSPVTVESWMMSPMDSSHTTSSPPLAPTAHVPCM